MTEFVRVNHANWKKCVRKDPDIVHDTLSVAMVIAEYGEYGTGTNVRPAMGTVAEEVGFKNRQSVYPHLRKIKEKNYLRQTGRHGKGVMVYELWAPADILREAGGTALGGPKGEPEQKAAMRPPTPVPRARKTAPEPPKPKAAAAAFLELPHHMFFEQGKCPDEWDFDDLDYETALRLYQALQ